MSDLFVLDERLLAFVIAMSHLKILIVFLSYSLILKKVEAQITWTKASADSLIKALQNTPNLNLLGHELDVYFENRLKNKELFDYLAEKTRSLKGKNAQKIHRIVIEHTARKYYIRKQKDIRSAIDYIEKVEKKAEYPCDIIQIWTGLVDEITQVRLDTLLAREILDKAYREAEKSKCFDEMILTEFLTGFFWGERYGNFKKYMTHLLKSMVLMEKYPCSIDTKIIIYDNLGSLFYKAGNYEKALKYWSDLLQLCSNLTEEEKKYFLGISTARLLNNMGLCYKHKEQYDTALSYYEKAIEVAKQNKDTFWINLPKGNIGDILIKRDNIERAYELFKDYLNNAYKYQDWGIVIAGYTKIANYHYLKGEYSLATEYLQAADKILSQKKEWIRTYNSILIANSQKNIWLNYSQVEKAKGNDKVALEYQTKYVQINDSINKLINIQQLEILATDLQVKQEVIKKELLQSDIKKQKYFVIVSSSITCISLLLGIMLFFNRQKLNKQKNLLEEKNKEIATANEAITLKNKDITDSILYAERIQKAFLPYETRISNILKDYFIIYKPRDIVSGDFYYILEQNELVFIIVGDCTGHGVPGALMSILGVTLLEQIIIEKQIQKPAEILDVLNQRVVKALHQKQSSNQDGMDISICVWNKNTKLLQIAGAKSPIVIIFEDNFKEIKTDRYSIGGANDKLGEKIFTEYECSIEENTMLYLFTDGYADQFDNKGHKKIGKKRFYNLLTLYHQKPILEQKHQLQNFLSGWQGNEEQIDDITVLGMRLV